MTLAAAPVIPEPGIYRDLPADAYHCWKLASNSYLGAMKRSPAHCRQMMDCPREKTPALVLGEAAHFAILQPDLFASRYSLLPPGDGRKAEVKEARAAAIARYGPDFLLSTDDYETCIKMRDSVWALPAARKILNARTDTEISAVWDDPDIGERCKLRSDLICRGKGIVADLKTTEDAGRGAFMRSIFKWAYYRQGAMYLEGWARSDFAAEHFCIIAVEKKPPYCAAAYRLEDEVLEEGRKEFSRLLLEFSECRQSGVWPGYSDKLESISLPPFAWKELAADSQEEETL